MRTKLCYPERAQILKHGEVLCDISRCHLCWGSSLYIYLYIFFFLWPGFCSEDYFSRIECKLYFFSYNLYRYYACDLLNGEAGCFDQYKIIERIGFMSDPLLADSSSTTQSASYLIFIGSLSLLQVGCSWLIGRGGKECLNFQRTNSVLSSIMR